MNHLFVRGLGCLAALTIIGLAPLACVVSNGGGGSGGGGSGAGPGPGTGTGASGAAQKVGVPCAPPDEKNPYFSGFKVSEDVIVTGAPECGAGVCLLNHFQGEVACPLGQAAPVDAQGLLGCTPQLDPMGYWVSGQGSCKAGDLCVVAGSLAPSCDLSQGQDTADQFCIGLGAGHNCGASGVCECKTDVDCLFLQDAAASCDQKMHQCVTYVCHEPGNCQSPGATVAENAGKACCLPGTDTPVTKAVCGQCQGQNGQATRDPDSAVYCTCRCGVADGAPDEPDYPFCGCPDGFECSQIRDDVGLGDQKLTGKYCIKAGTAYDPSKDQCGLVSGHLDTTCKGVPSGGSN